MGYITNKMPKDRKHKILIAFDIVVLLVFTWWAFNERLSYIQGYTDTLNAICGRYVIDFCPAWEKSKNMTPSDISSFNRTGTELPIIYREINSSRYCDTGNGTSCLL
jgi:hypothetical protein